MQDVEQFSVRKYSYIYMVSGWILQIDISTTIPWIIGSTTQVNVSINVVEYQENSLLSITSLTISTGNVSIARYIGNFTHVGEQRSVTILLPVIEPSYTAIGPGESKNVFINVRLDGYIKTMVNDTKKNFSAVFSFPVVVSSPPSILVLSVNSPRSIEAGVGFFQVIIMAMNTGSTQLYNVYLAIYINGSLYRTIYLRTMEQNNITKTIIPINVDRPGIYVISATANYTTPIGTIGHSLAYAITIVKNRPNIYITSNTSIARVFTPIEIRGMVSVYLNSIVSIEISQNGVEWQGIASIYVEKNSFRYVWIPNITGKYMIRASVPTTDLYSSSTSNILFITIEKVTPKLLMTGSKVSGSQIKLSVQVDPKMTIDIDIMYRTSKDYNWRKYTSIKTNSDGRGETMFIALQPDIYEFKAVVNENNVLTYAESNTISINMQQETASALQQTVETKTINRYLDQYTVVIVIAISALIAALLLFTGRKR